MIALLRGRIVAAGLAEVIVDVGGVGFAVRIPPGTPLGARDDEVVLHTHLAVREDALTLYGFSTAEAKTLFEVLLSVTGVGPKVALAVLGTLGTHRLRGAVLAEDWRALTAVPGVGRKGAQRMVLELRERLGALPSEELPGDAYGAAGDARGEAAQALVSLGYAPVEAQQAVEALPADADASPEQLLHDALRAIGRSD